MTATTVPTAGTRTTTGRFDRHGKAKLASASNGQTSAQRLWDALVEARGGRTPRTLAHVEDAVFRFYLPLAHSLARHPSCGALDPDRALQAAELGLAQAILGWRRTESALFPAFALAAIQSRLVDLDGGPADPRGRA